MPKEAMFTLKLEAELRDWIACRVEPDAVVILRLLHGAQLWPHAL